MRSLFQMLLALALTQPLGLLAKAGTSYTQTTSKSTNIGTKANNTVATTQYSSTALKPTTTIKPAATTTQSVPTTTKTVASTPTQTTTTTTTAQQAPQPTVINNTTVIRDQRQSSDNSFASSMMGAAAGVVVADALVGNHHNQPTTVVVQQPVQAQQPVQQQAYVAPSSQSTYTAQTPLIVEQKQQQTPKKESDSSFLSTLFALLGIAAVLGVFYYFYKKKQTSLANVQKNVPNFMSMFIRIQKLSTLTNSLDKEELIPLCTDQMFLELTKINSENLENGLQNVIEDISIINATIIDNKSDDNAHYCSVKFNYKMIDYCIDENGTVIHGSKDRHQTGIEVWTFKTTNYRDWKLTAIEQYVK